MTALYLVFALLSGAAFYLASSHQRLWPRVHARRGWMRLFAWMSCLAAVAAAIVELGVWAGVFAAITALMLTMVLLPYLDAGRQLRGERRDVG